MGSWVMALPDVQLFMSMGTCHGSASEWGNCTDCNCGANLTYWVLWLW